MQTWVGRRQAAWLGLLTILIASQFESRDAKAQGAPSGFFSDPVLVLRVGGHQAPVRSMVWTPSGTQLLTGGMDKVINVWNVDNDRSGPPRSLRPPQWRASRGQVNALALSPRDDGGDQRLLAVAGAGVLGVQGEILLFRYPGLNGLSTGDVIGQLPTTAADGTIGEGHAGVVTSLAFTPDGRYLVSSSNDQTVRVWDVDARKQVAVLRDSKAEVNGLSLFTNGTKLVTAGKDGVVRLYDLTVKERPRLIAQHPKQGRNPPFSLLTQINVIAASPDGRWIVTGSELGAVSLYDSALEQNPKVIEKNKDEQLEFPVEAISFSPDGTKLAISTITRNLEANKAGIPTASCFVLIRSMPDGKLIEALPAQSNLIQAVAFSPDSKRLAYSGGDAQAIFLKDLGANPPALPEEIKGYGSSLWDVGFRTDNQAVRFSRAKPAAGGQAVEYEYFNLRGRYFFNPEANELPYRHATSVEAGWTITPINQYKLGFVNGQGQRAEGDLHPINERRWWAYTVIPPGPGHSQPVAAVAADAAIVLFNLADGKKTRVFNGHIGPVYAIASSPDGKWLLTGSADQTVRLWPLDGCDTPPKFGAKFDRQGNGSWVVSEVTPGGFADGIALKKGHVIEKFFIGKDGPAQQEDPSVYLPNLDQESPSWMFSFFARMNGDANQPLLQVGATKRDSPALSLFPGVDRRWVLWTPRGYYDSSADGDRKFLGWLTNRGTVAQLLASTFDSIDKFETRFRQPKAPIPNVIDRLLDTANPLLADAVVAAPVNPAQPPSPDPVTSRLAALELTPVAPVPVDRPVVAVQPTIPLKYRALAQAGAAGISRLWVEVNGRNVANLIAANAPPARDVQGQSEIPLGTDRNVRVSLVAVDERGVRRDQPIDITNQAPPPPTRRKSRLEIVAVGADEFTDKRYPPILYAEDDAQDLTKFLSEKLVDSATGAKFGPTQIHTQTFIGGKMSRANLVAAFDTLYRPTNGDPLGPGDVVVVVVESHYLNLHSKRLMATTDPNAGLPEPPSFSANDLADRLAELSRAGCRAVVLVDAVHEVKSPSWDLDIQEWVRQLQRDARVVTFIAADHGPSSPNGDGHRVFAQGILDVLKAKSAGRLRSPAGTMSLFDFQRTVTDSVLQQTGRKQHAQCYLPDTIPLQVPFLVDPSIR